MKSTKKINLMIIDPQNDFCDIPESLCPANPIVSGSVIKPALPVTGAHEDMLRLAAFINRVGDRLNDIHVTLDSHNPVDIAHPCWWVDSAGNNPGVFTIISVNDVKTGIWRTANPMAQSYSLGYVESLAAGGRFPLCIWPEHCLIGSWGHNVHMSVKGALDAWARRRLETINFVTKGSNPKTEHYSAVRAEVLDPADPTTLLNSNLIDELAACDMIIVAGEALSHCVANTVRDIANNFGDENIKKMILLEDCASSVPGFEQAGRDFVTEMVARGMKVARSTELFA